METSNSKAITKEPFPLKLLLQGWTLKVCSCSIIFMLMTPNLVIMAVEDMLFGHWNERGKGVMINFMCLLDWAMGRSDTWLDIILGVLWGCFWMRFTFEWVELSRLPSPVWMDLTQVTEVLDRRKKAKGEFSLFSCLQAGTLVFSCLWAWPGTAPSPLLGCCRCWETAQPP